MKYVKMSPAVEGVWAHFQALSLETVSSQWEKSNEAGARASLLLVPFELSFLSNHRE